MVGKRFSPVLVADDSDIEEIHEKPRTSRRTQKRLVKNGCISPLNVAKAKQSAQKQNNTSQQDDSETGKELTDEDKDSRRLKGKGLLTNNILLEEYDEKRKPLYGRNLAGKLDGASLANKEACVRSEEAGGWISTRKRTRKLNTSLSDEEHLCHRADDPSNVIKLPRNAVVRGDNKDGSNLSKRSVSSQHVSAAGGWISTRKRTRKLNTSLSDEEHLCRRADDPCNVTKLPSNAVVRGDNKDESNVSKQSVSSQNVSVAGGWISTRKRTRKLNTSLSDEEPLCRMADDPCNVTKLPRNAVVRGHNKDGSNVRKHSVSSQNVSVAPISQTLTQKRQGCLLNEHPGSSNTAVKRQKQRSSGTHHCESSSSPIGNSEVLGFGSSGEQSNIRSVGTHNSRTVSSVDRIIDIDDFPPERSNASHNIDYGRNSESDDRVVQLEEDEILALELQEQFYNESNVAADREIDEQIAWELYQGSLQHTFPNRSHHESHPPSSYRSNLHRQNLSQSSQNSSTRRVTQDRVPTSTGMPQLRRRFPRTISSRQRNSLFPPSTGVHMRMHIPEALESVNNLGVASGLLQLQRDFNENDYEMLLDLDENNDQHCGASAAQINVLPESTVQTDNLEKCSVCLETPSIGDAIRHLPCLHRFHKDCIDEWLRRRRSCPICKSYIT